MDRKWSAVRPSPLLVRLLALTALATAAALPFPALMAPALAFAGVVLLLAASDWAISRNDPAPQIERVLPTRLIKDRSATVVYRIRRAAGAATTINLLDELPEALGGELRITGVRLGRGQLLQISREIVPARRGTFELGPTLILWRSYLGLLGLRAGVTTGDAVAILPPASTPQRRAGLNHRSLRDELGIKPRPLRGEGREFESLREYVSGDDPRHIDWRASARHFHLQVRQYQTERRHTVFVALDTGRLMGAYGDRIGFVAFDNALRLFARPRSGLGGVGAMLDATSSLLPSSFEPDYRILVETLARQQKKRALIVVLTDFVEGGTSRGLEDYLAVLARRHCVMLVALRDRMLREVDEREPEISRERLYRRLALQDLVAEREAVLVRIGRFGAQVLDLDPSQITAPVLNRYLAVRDAALI